MRWVFLGMGLVSALIVTVLGPRGQVNQRRPLMLIPDMDFQARYNPQAPSPFFADGRAMRTPPAGTVAFGGANYNADAGSPRQVPDFLRDDDAYYRGKQGAGWVARVPLTVDNALLHRGRERYDIFCAPCHGATGTGDGIMTLYGLTGVASITDELHKLMPDGQFFDVISNGKGRMLPYAPQIKMRDRWAIVTYVRALSRSQHASPADVAAEE